MKRLLGLLALGFPHSCLLLVASELQGGGWGSGVCHHQAGETLLLLPQWLQRRAVKLCLSLYCEAPVQASANLFTFH